MASDITSLIISTKSEGIQASTKDLNELVKAADKAAQSTEKLKNSGKQQADAQKSSTSALENALLAMKKQVDLLGASVAKTNSYNAALKGADAAQLAVASSLGRQVDNYRSLSVAQAAAIRENNALDASNTKLAASQKAAQTAGNNLNDLGQRTQSYQRLSAAQAEAIRMNAALNRSQSSGSNLNLSGQRAEDFRKLAAAQQEAIRMNNAFNASIERQKMTMQSRDIDTHRLSVQQYTQAHAEAIRMNNAHDAAARRLADGVRVNTNNIRNNNDVMREAQALARGLSGSLGALWLTYGNFVGMAAGLAIGFSLKGIVTVGADVENTLEGIRVRGTETIASVAEVREAVLRIGEGVYGPQEVAKAFEALTLAGLKVVESTLAVGAALNLALVGGTSIEKAAESLVSIGTAVGATAKSFDYLADGIVAAANTSLASVDSISASVKRASIVNKLYGASFEDILTQTAALAQLGIKNTAAGTAITNFYNNAVGNTGKSRKALDDLGMSFTDATGKAKPLVAAFEEFTQKLNKYDLKSQQNFINDIFGERALRDVEGLRDAVNNSANDTEKYSNRLREIQGQISDSAGTSALEAVQLGLTTQKSLASIGNTLRVSFTEVFKELAPSLLIISARLREAFGSEEFKGGLSNIANGVGNVALAIVNNIGVLGNLIELFIVFKAATIGASLFEGIAKGLLGIATAMGFVTVATNGAVVATGALRIAMLAIPLIGLAVTALSIGLALAAFHTNEVKDNSQALADTYNKDFLKALEDEAKRLEKSNELMIAGASATDAATRSLKELALEKSRQINTDNVAKAQGTFDSANAVVNSTAYIIKSVDYTFDSKNSPETRALTKATNDLNIARKAANDFDAESIRLTDKIVAASKLKADLYKQEQKDKEEAAKAAAGTAVYDRTKEDTKGINDSYRAAQVAIESQIKKAKQGMQDFEDVQNDRFKAGEIGKLTLIRDIGAQQIEAYDKIAKELAAKRIVAQGGKNKKADVERIDGLAEANTEALAQANRKVASETNVELARLEHDSTKYYISELEARGEFSKAASEKFSAEYSMAIKQVTADFDKFGYAIPAVAYAMDSLRKAKEAVMATSDVKEATAEFEKQNAVIVNLFKGVQTASEGQGMAEMYKAASNAAEEYASKLPKLLEAQQELAAKALVSGSPADVTKSEEALTKIKANAEHLKTMWSGVGESISKSLESAFGKSGKAVGDFVKIFENYNRTDKQSTSARIKSYGDTAAAAKNFFDESSAGYKVLQTTEQVFRAYELAETLRVFIAKSGMMTSLLGIKIATDDAAAASDDTYTFSSIAKSGLRAAADGIAAIAKAIASLPFPLNIAAGAATAAALVGFGVKVFGGSSGGSSLAEEQQAQKDRIANQGTGTVFGDSSAKSGSIGKSIELIAKYTYENLDFSSKMLTTMRSIAESLTGVSKSLLLTVGLTSGSAFGTTEKAMGSGILSSLFGSSSRNITGSGININGSIGQLANGGGSATGYENVTTQKSGSLFGLFGGGSSNSTQNFELGADFKAAINKAYASVREGIIEVGTQLGLGADDLATKLNNIQSKVTVETRGLKGKELTDAVEAVFSAEMDRISALTLSLVREYNVAGEGMLETAVRVANTSRVIDMQLLSAGDTFGAVGESSLKMRMSLVSLAGGLDEFVTKSNFFKDNFLSEAERMAPITKQLNEEMARLNISSITTNEAFKNLVLAQDKSTPAGQAMYTALLNIQGAFYKNTEFAGKLALATTAVSNAQQVALDVISKRRSQLQTSYDSEKTALQSVIDKMKTFSEGMKSFKESLTTGADSPFTNAEKYARAFAKFNEVSVLAKSGDATAQADFQNVANNLLATSKIYNASGSQYMTDFNRVLSQTTALGESSLSQVNVAQASLDALTAQVTGLLDINKSVMSVTDAISELRFAITGGYAEGLTSSQMGIDGSHANGLMSVPFDGYIAELHKGEQVLTAPQAINYRGMGTMDMAPLVAEIKSLREEVCSLRADQDTQTRASIQATYDASGKNASSVVNGIDSSLNKVSSKTTIPLN